MKNTSHLSKIPNVRTVFELRRTKTTRQRNIQGRIFLHQNKFGICDASGCLWPIQFQLECSHFNSGDLISCIYEFNQDNKNNGTELNDLSYFCFVTEILEHTPSLEKWKNEIIPDPIQPIEHHQILNEKYSLYYPSTTSQRFSLVEKRNKMMSRVECYFKNRGFLKIDTPNLVPSGGIETYLTPFQTNYVDHRNKVTKLQLSTSPEFALKKILTEGTPKVFHIAKSFRNHAELSEQHEPEFNMLEWYRSNATLHDILEDTKKLILDLADKFSSPIEIPKNWRVFKVDHLFLEILNCNLNELQNTKDFYEATKKHSPSLRETDTWDDIFCKLFMEKVEPLLQREVACFVTNYPIQMAALACENPENKNFALRAEAYLNGIEICNAYQELNEFSVLETRFHKSLDARPDVLMSDKVFENAMKFGLPKCAGNALGIDRVIAILCGEKQISNLKAIPFASQFLKGEIFLE